MRRESRERPGKQGEQDCHKSLLDLMRKRSPQAVTKKGRRSNGKGRKRLQGRYQKEEKTLPNGEFREPQQDQEWEKTFTWAWRGIFHEVD